MMRARRRCRRAFASITAIALMAMIGVMLLAIGWLLLSDARRTLGGNRDAQLRQMLIAGSWAAAQQQGADAAAAPTTQPMSIPLPPELLARDGRLELRTVPSTQPTVRHIEIIAQLDDASMRQSLQLEVTEGQWTPTTAVLEPSVRVKSRRSPTTLPTNRAATRPTTNGSE